MSDRFDEIRARLANATPGLAVTDGVDASFYDNGTVVYEVYTNATSAHAGDAALFDNAPADLAWLLGEVERLSGGLCCYCEERLYPPEPRAQPPAPAEVKTHCGHAPSSIATSTEGTAHCMDCEAAAKPLAEVQKAANGVKDWMAEGDAPSEVPNGLR